MNISLHIDGGSRGNPGPAAVGVVIRDLDSERPLFEAGYFLGVTTNNVAEYQGLLRGLNIAAEMNPDDLRIYSDSELMVKQITGDYRVKSPDLQPLYQQAQRLLLRLSSWQIRHVRREENQRADELVNMALNAKSDIVIEKPGGSGKPVGGGNGKVNDNATQATDPATGATATLFPHEDVEIPRWSATLEGPHTCPMGCPVGRRFDFGPQTPKGFCVHAGQAMYMTDPFTLMESVETACHQCGLLIRVEV